VGNLKSRYKTLKILKPDTSMGANSTVSGDLKSLFTDDEGHVVGHLVEALRYKPGGCGFDGANGIFHRHNPSGHTMALGLNQPLTQTSTRNISWGVKVAGV
jgi:hypothetical protein